MADRFRISSMLPHRLAELNVPPRAVLRQAGLPDTLFNGGKVFLTTDEFFRLYEAITSVSQDPCIGLKIGAEERVECYDPISIAALHSRSFRDAVERLARYKQLICPEELQIIERGSECALRFKFLLTDESEPDAL